MLRKRTPVSYDNFFSFVFKKHDSRDMNELMQWLQIGHIRLGYSLFGTIPADALDLALTMSLNVMGSWRADLSGPIELVHDASTNMSDQRHIWDALMNPNLPRARLGYDDHRRIEFPIAVKRTLFEPSEKWAGLQLADVTAGAFARFTRWLIDGKNPNDAYGSRLADVVGEMAVLPLWPETKITPEELGTLGHALGDPLEYYVKHIVR